MNRYRHTKGVINDNALQALLHDPLFRVRREKNQKGKGSYRRKNRDNRQEGEGNGKTLFSITFIRAIKKPLSLWNSGFSSVGLLFFFQQITDFGQQSFFS